MEAGADFLREGDIAEVELQPLVPLVVEAFRDYPGLGRFAVRAAMRREGAAAAGGGGGGGSAVGGCVTSVILALGRVEVRLWTWRAGNYLRIIYGRWGGLWN